MQPEQPKIIRGGLHSDVRGSVAFVNDFDFKGVDRFYTIRCREPNQPRGWVGHRRDRKWFTVVQGKFLIAVVRPDHWTAPSGRERVQHFVLLADEPGVLCVPAGYATAQMALTADAILTVFSSGSIQSAKEDDYRFALTQWNVAGDD